MTTTFETAKVGDRVWSMGIGWGEILHTSHSARYPIRVQFQKGEYETYTLGGAYDAEVKIQYLFWDEIKFEAPKKPLPNLEVDAKVLVWTDPSVKQKRHFSHFDEDGRICVFESGRTSYTRIYRSNTTAWPNWELAE